MQSDYQTGLTAAFLLAALLLLIAAGAALVAAMRPASPRRLNTLLLAKTLFASTFFVFGVIPLWLRLTAPTAHAQGTIHNIHLAPGSSRRSTTFHLTTPTGSELTLTAPGTSLFFRTGQQASLTYELPTHLVRNATFLTADGKKEGAFNGAILWPWLSIAVGLILFWAAFKTHTRNLARLQPPSPSEP